MIDGAVNTMMMAMMDDWLWMWMMMMMMMISLNHFNPFHPCLVGICWPTSCPWFCHECPKFPFIKDIYKLITFDWCLCATSMMIFVGEAWCFQTFFPRITVPSFEKSFWEVRWNQELGFISMLTLNQKLLYSRCFGFSLLLRKDEACRN